MPQLKTKEQYHDGNYSIYQSSGLNGGWFSQLEVEEDSLLLPQTCLLVQTRRHSECRRRSRRQLVAIRQLPIPGARRSRGRALHRVRRTLGTRRRASQGTHPWPSEAGGTVGTTADEGL